MQTGTAGVCDPGIRDDTRTSQLDAPSNDPLVSVLRLRHADGEPRIRHPVEDVPNGLRMVLVQDIDDLRIQLLQFGVGGAVSHRIATFLTGGRLNAAQILP